MEWKRMLVCYVKRKEMRAAENMFCFVLSLPHLILCFLDMVGIPTSSPNKYSCLLSVPYNFIILVLFVLLLIGVFFLIYLFKGI